MVRQLRDDLRYLLLDQFGAELRAAFDDVLSATLLDRLAEAEAPEDYRVVRLLRELLLEIEEERPTWR